LQHASLHTPTCHVGVHSVTCHPAEVAFPPLPQPKLVVDLATPDSRRDARLSCPRVDLMKLPLHNAVFSFACAFLLYTANM